MKNNRKIKREEKEIDIYMCKLYDEINPKTFLDGGRTQDGCFN